LQPNQELEEDGELQPAIINEDFRDFESDVYNLLNLIKLI
jgi:hypothetical protein